MGEGTAYWVWFVYVKTCSTNLIGTLHSSVSISSFQYFATQLSVVFTI
jgi:hypothetical protein